MKKEEDYSQNYEEYIDRILAQRNPEDDEEEKDPSFRDVFPINLRKCRERIHLTQTQLAASLGLNNSTISSWENGYSVPDFDNIEALCMALNVFPDELILGKPIEPYFSLDEQRIITLYRATNDVGRRAIMQLAESLVEQSRIDELDFNYLRHQRLNIKELFLKQNDPDYTEMVSLLPELRNLKDSAKPLRSHADIADFLRHTGVDDCITEFDIKAIFLSKPKKVPSRQLYLYIKSYLMGEYDVILRDY